MWRAPFELGSTLDQSLLAVFRSTWIISKILKRRCLARFWDAASTSSGLLFGELEGREANVRSWHEADIAIEHRDVSYW